MTAHSLRLLGAVALLLAPCGATAAEAWLVAMKTTKTMPDGQSIPMWGFAQATWEQYGQLLSGQDVPLTATVPGPALKVPAGDTTLTVHVLNKLQEPVSLMMPGQVVPSQPTWIEITNPGTAKGTGPRPAGDVTSRVRSMAAEVPANGGTQTYTWENLKPGSFLYHSATHPALQVQMGLYGAALVEAGTPRRQLALVYGEVDAAFHRAVEANQPPSSTLRYAPTYHFVEVQGWDAQGNKLEPTGKELPLLQGESTLLRFYNAALRTHVPILQDNLLDLIAEDGNPYPFPKRQYSVMLDAGKTKDALLVPTREGRFALYDRAVNSGGPGSTRQDMVTYLAVAAQAVPVAANDAYTVANGSLIVTDPAQGVLSNDTASSGTLQATLQTPPAHAASFTLNANGTFTYTGADNYLGADAFTYVATQGTVVSKPATVSLTVQPAYRLPVTQADTYKVTQGQTLNVSAAQGVLANDTRTAGTNVTASLVAPLTGLTLQPDGSFTYAAAPTYSGTVSFQYRITDNHNPPGSAVGTATITVEQVVLQNPVAQAHTYTVTYQQARAGSGAPLDVLTYASTPNAGAQLVPSSIVATRPVRGGTLTIDRTTGVIFYKARTGFVGTDRFSYTVRDTTGRISNSATITVNVTP